jgi:nucleoside-diphosphate-sugar epimerase
MNERIVPVLTRRGNSAVQQASYQQAFIAGCGDVGQRLAVLCHARSLPVTGLVSSSASVQALRAQAIDALTCDLDAAVPQLPDLTKSAVFYFAPPPRQGEDDPRLRNFLAGLVQAQALVYLSTSAVYGDCQGAWVDESAAMNPGLARGRRRVAAERRALEWGSQKKCPVMILRVPGIYGPGRLPVERLRRGLPVVQEAESPWTNRIHADDLAAAALHVADHGVPGQAYNVSDGNPTTMADYFCRCADLLGLSRPPQVSMEEARSQLTPEMLSFLQESKRLDTRRLRALGWQPRFENLTQGLPSCL